jgi:hypothetical protein
MDRPINRTSLPDRQLVLGTFEDQSQAAAAVKELRHRGVQETNISVVVRHEGPEISAGEMVAIEREAEATGTDVAVGGVTGGLAGFMAGLAIFSIPGLGPFLGIGVLAGTLGGAALGSAVGERTAHLSQLGIPIDRAERYHHAMETGHTMMAVTADDAEEVMIAREVLAMHGAEEIDVHPLSSDEGTPA